MAITLNEAFDALLEADERIDQLGDDELTTASLQVIVKMKIEKALSDQKQISVSIDVDGEDRKSCTYEELVRIYNDKRRELAGIKAEKGENDSEYIDLLAKFYNFLEQIRRKEGLPLVLGDRVEKIISTLVKARISRVISESEPIPESKDGFPQGVDRLDDPEFLRTQFVMVGPGFIVRGDHAGGAADRHVFDVGGQQMVVPRDSEAAMNLGMSPENAAFFNNPLKGKQVFGLGEGDEEIPDLFGGPPRRLPKLKPEMFPDVEEGSVIAEGKMQFVMGGIAPELGGDCEVLIGDDGKVYADNNLFRGSHDERVRLIKDGDGLKVEKV
ncbi:hypothetical protein HOG17_05530 [Candidatus Peregrinibacteria bacterium]|jgi:hypothetical protein|nr:hypothetical protein [Candidatus Peregrinibacteria bacterium]MBT4148136.1 hypothetical protein [Candidatus Peregrinibacteria bacterium]MBT4366623.1 hypothetical protein [Candidatus Peregrinibacteria bacterium]MBT4455610.1 hypothetical protein [Candidatus Peregrinibacteria bacterium]